MASFRKTVNRYRVAGRGRKLPYSAAAMALAATDDVSTGSLARSSEALKHQLAASIQNRHPSARNWPRYFTALTNPQARRVHRSQRVTYFARVTAPSGACFRVYLGAALSRTSNSVARLWSEVPVLCSTGRQPTVKRVRQYEEPVRL